MSGAFFVIIRELVFASSSDLNRYYFGCARVFSCVLCLSIGPWILPPLVSQVLGSMKELAGFLEHLGSYYLKFCVDVCVSVFSSCKFFYWRFSG